MPWALIVAMLTPILGGVSGGKAASTTISLSYEHDVRPIFKTHCFQCHGENGVHKAGLDLRLQRLAMKGGKHGAAIVPGKPELSLIVKRLRADEMPPEGKPRLSTTEIQIISRWVEQGARVARAEPQVVSDEPVITEEDRRYWAFQPVRAVQPPAVKHADRVRTPIDSFVLAKLEEKGFSFSDDADRPALIRRATFDLIGLPPTPEEVNAFVADTSADAYEKVIDRLLASPHYGEHWGRHWLDVAGYADSDGYNETDVERRFAWHYRDYVIRSFNADKPLDQFIVEQLAGDELVKPPYKELAPADLDKLIATGFLRMAPDGSAVVSTSTRKAVANQVVADEIKVVATSLLGLTVGCAQCHDHRYDPIPQLDYYRLRAIFEPAFNPLAWRVPRERLISLLNDADQARSKEIEAKAAQVDVERMKWENEQLAIEFEKQLPHVPEELREPIRAAFNTPPAKRTPAQVMLLKLHPNVNMVFGNLVSAYPNIRKEQEKRLAEAAKLRATKPVEEFVEALTEVPGQIPPTHLFNRGDCDQPKQVVSPSDLGVVSSDTVPVPEKDGSLPTSGRRLAYARWLTSGKHPLVGRVLVNRIWMHHFGKGIVATPGDFGVLGDRPTHPELLDWLATDLASHGWELKRLHKLMMLSTAYRQSSAHDPAKDAVDPDNKLVGRQSLHRLESEEFRDAILYGSGQLNTKMFGPPVPVMADAFGQIVIGKENLSAGRPGPVIPMKGEDYRRSVYVQVRRSRPLSVLATFDEPTMEPNCDARKCSTVAPQSLLLMNNEFVIARSEEFAQRVREEAGADPEAQVRRAWELAIGSEPSRADLDVLVQFLGQQTARFQKRQIATTQPAGVKSAGVKQMNLDPSLEALGTLGQALWSSNAFLYVD
jgi:mono/diheme cytochrome c family protein